MICKQIDSQKPKSQFPSKTVVRSFDFLHKHHKRYERVSVFFDYPKPRHMTAQSYVYASSSINCVQQANVSTGHSMASLLPRGRTRGEQHNTTGCNLDASIAHVRLTVTLNHNNRLRSLQATHRTYPEHGHGNGYQGNAIFHR